ncbi:shikimate dehydrogenase [Ereboglobus sp. PH5-5]|uniref:shikimate dehydrogenase n=1 Tax=Ereboglobus sp. PH5-5 TaxID=2940529 RepID=UPI0024063B8C|nr:shikimate dehydrogenase [Ereboglobus sp. PH5-5]MDF9832918.1 shikimate dehydrogenase [Ereboglobus sp. PH5-5]
MSTADTTVYTLADLETWSRPGTHLAVLGRPIAHSLSPLMHNAALAQMTARDPRYRDWRYHRFDIAPEDLPRALAIFHEKKFHGLNLTAPHKVIALDCVAEIDPAAAPAGAVNTLTWTANGWHGANTDGHGLATAIRETLGLELRDSHILLLGAGGAARGAAVECLQRRCASLAIANRTRANLDALLDAMRPLAGDIPLSAFQPFSHSAFLIINATSSGLRPADAPPIDLAAFPANARPLAVFDMIYNPPQTPLLAQAAALGIPRANGLSMLIHQGARSLEIWTGEKIPVEAMRNALQKARKPESRGTRKPKGQNPKP